MMCALSRDVDVLPDTVAEPSTSLQLLTVDAERARLHHGWLSSVAVLLVDLGDDDHAMVELAVGEVPDELARLADAHEDASRTASAVVDETTLDALFSDDAAERAAAAADLLGQGGRQPGELAGADWHAACLDVATVSADHTVTRRLAWVEAGGRVVPLTAAGETDDAFGSFPGGLRSAVAALLLPPLA